MPKNWFDEWEVLPWGIAGGSSVLACPKADRDQPNKTPDCYIDLDLLTLEEIRRRAAQHRRKTNHLKRKVK
jgi:hypothetical protein